MTVKMLLRAGRLQLKPVVFRTNSMPHALLKLSAPEWIAFEIVFRM